MNDKPIDLSGNSVDVALRIMDLPEEYLDMDVVNEMRDFLNEPIEPDTPSYAYINIPVAGEALTLPPFYGIRGIGEWNKYRIRKLSEKL